MKPAKSKWVRAGVLAGTPELVADLGGDFAALAKEAGLLPSFLDAPDTPIEATAIPRFLDIASERLVCPAFGLRLGQYQDFGLFGDLGLPLRTAATVGDLLHRLAALFPFHTQGAIVSLAKEGSDLLVAYELSADIYRSHRQVVELGFNILVSEIRRHHPGWQSAYVAFRHAPPSDLSWHHRLLGPRILFNADRNAMLLDTELLALPRRPDGDLLLAASGSGRLNPEDLVPLHTERLVRASLPSRLLMVGEAAAMLGMSKRSLQRRLAAADTSFEAIIDAVRADLALAYLTDSRLSVAQIAEALLFSESSALSRAARRWYRRSPRELRRHGRLRS